MFKQWVQDYCWPVTQAVSIHDAENSLELLQAARESIPISAEQPLDREPFEVALIWHDYVYHRSFSPDEIVRTISEEYQSQLSSPCQSNAGKQQRLKALLCIRLDSESVGIGSITRQEIDELVDLIDEGQVNVLIWHHIVPWAFEHRDLELSAKAVEVLLNNRRISRQAYAFRRAEMLHAILAGKATFEMMSKYCSLLDDQSPIREFIDTVLPVALEKGLIDEQQSRQIAEQHSAH